MNSNKAVLKQLCFLGPELMNINFENAARYCCLVMLASLSFSTAGANLALVGFLVCAIFSKKWLDEFRWLASSSVAKASLLCFALLCLSTGWSEANWALSLAWISKYKKLLILPLIMPFFQERKDRVVFVNVLFFSLLSGLAVSYLNYFGWTSIGDCPEVGCSTHSYITLSMLNCLLFLVSLALFSSDVDFRKKLFYGLCMLLSAVNVIFVLPSRTGQILFFILLVWLPFAIWAGGVVNARRKWAGLVVSLLLISISLATLQTMKGSRLIESIEKIGAHKVEVFKANNDAISVDVRFEFYRKAFILIQQKPLLGWGAGAHESEFLRMSAQGNTPNEQFKFANPHNEYLSWAVQTGLIGLVVFLYWLFAVWRKSMQIVNADERLIFHGWFLIFTVGSFLNSFLLDFSEGYMMVLLIAALIPLRQRELIPK
jgi:O-antigen ligase